VTAALRPKQGQSASLGAVSALDFALPDELVAHEPPEARGLARDGVRLLVSDPDTDDVRHATARELPDFLGPGDVLVVNASSTINAALDAWRSERGSATEALVALHLSSPVPWSKDERRWVVELRRLTSDGTQPLLDARTGDRIRLRGGASARLLAPFGDRASGLPTGSVRLWDAELTCPGGVLSYAAEFGAPIRYGYVRERWPLYMYQTMFGMEPGSAEMPSAGRPFTADVVMRLQSKGVAIAPIILHTGVASLEAGETPYAERFRVASCAANAVNRARENGGRVVAVGTTVVRALETVASPDGTVSGGEGWTDLVVTPERGVRAVDALVTGFHEPRASHLAMLEAIAGRDHLAIAYRAALEKGYLWHEFGDLHLLIRSEERATRGKWGMGGV
jgi:S-adenosylmethionine:tRNA ribosyltransferase-isomerase